MMTPSLSVFFFIFTISSVGAFDDENETFIIANSSNEFKNDTHVSHSEFPEDLFTEEQRKNGAIILHVILAIYCFMIIATVCTEFFMPTISCICNALKLSDDVAAATFMSIATSSPEFFTNIIGTFITNSDIGVGHVLGNAYYDMFFVASLGGLAASQKITLDWWPITRDCIIYLIVAITLTWVVWDGRIETYETVILLFLYVVYFIIMFNNRAIIRKLNSRFKLKIMDPFEDTGETNSGGTAETTIRMEIEEEPLRQETYAEAQSINKRANDENDHEAIMELSTIKVSTKKDLTHKKKKSPINRICSLLMLPVTILTAITIPDVRKHRWKHFYPLSFILCVGWIGISTYLGTWMISVIGETVGIPDIIMGMVFMAAGGSVVEAYGVYYKARRGECSIGLSNSMGCNTLDVTMCLALPWLIKSILPSTSDTGILLSSQVLHVNCTLLIVSVLVIFGILYANSFQLNWKLGLCSGTAYIAVLAIAITVETQQTPKS